MPPILALLLAASPVLFALPSTPTIDVEPETEWPAVTAEAWLLYDEEFDYEIASDNADEVRPMASTTKIMTALLVDELAERDDLVTVSTRAERTNQKQVYLRRGEVFTVGDLLATLMVASANDSAVALAEHVAGDVDSFVDLMNARADSLGLESTQYRNPHGLDATGHVSSARDLLNLAREAIDHPVLAELAVRRSIRFDGDVYETTNELLLGDEDGVIGLKTGYTRRAGRVLVAVAEREGRRLFAVIMGSDDSFADARELFDFGFRTFREPELKLVELTTPDVFPDLVASLPEPMSSRVLHVWGHRQRLAANWE